MAATETGGRAPTGWVARTLFVIAVAWSLFQIWIVSPIPYMLDWGVVGETRARPIHLGFALLLAFLTFPALRPRTDGIVLPLWRRYSAFAWALVAIVCAVLASRHGASGNPFWMVFASMAALSALLAVMVLRSETRERIPLLDVALALAALGCTLYLHLFYRDLAGRPGSPIVMDLVISGCGVLLLLEAARRTMGPALAVIAAVFLLYGFLGPYMPDLIAHRGASFGRAMSQQWLSNEGVFGIAVGVSTSFVFLFVLFGALLNQAGAGGYFIRVAFAFLGHLRGGPAKASVIASGLNGLVSGSSIANTVTTGTFTIPVMRRVGFSAEKAGAIEVSSSVNGQIMPPVMGAAAFLMAEYVNIPYTEVVRHAFLPAVIAYIALLYIVHLEALKLGMEPRARNRPPSPLYATLLRVGFTVSGLMVVAGLVYYGLGWVKTVFGDAASWIITGLVVVTYVLLLRVAVAYTDHDFEARGEPDLDNLPAPKQALLSGLHFILPVVVLVWALIVERLSPGLSAFWAVVTLIGILLSQRPLLALFAGESDRLPATVRHSVYDLLNALAAGARNMVGIAIATASAGIIVGTVSMTGLGLVMTEIVETLSGGHLMLMLALTALISLILGLGLPTTANYIIVATLMAPVVVELGAQEGLLVPLIAVHLFVFYFGLMADVTPPVGLASYAAAAVSGGDPIRTGLQAIVYNLRTLALPFLFIFNTQLLLIDVGGVGGLALTVSTAILAMLVFASATQGWFVVRNRWYESAILLLVAFTLFRPEYWMDRIEPPYEELGADAVMEQVEAIPEGGFLRMRAEGMDARGDDAQRTVMIRLGEEQPAEARLRDAGLGVMAFGDQVQVNDVRRDSAADRAGIGSGWQVTAVMVPAERPAAEWFYIPALAVLGGVWLLQRRRLRVSAEYARQSVSA